MSTLTIPELSLVVLIGPSGSGKSTFARRHFLLTEVISSDFCRALIADDENDQASTAEAFDLLHVIAGKRLAGGRLAVVDATNVQPTARRSLVALAREYHAVPVALVFDLPEGQCQDRNRARSDRQIPAGALHRQVEQMRRGLRGLQKEGFRYVFRLTSDQQVEAAQIQRQPTWTNRSGEHGPFDVIGDVHGCCDELETLLEELGYVFTLTDGSGTYSRLYSHPQGRKAVFLGDLVDRGPRVLDTLQLVHSMVQAGNALAVPGNHDARLVRKLQGRDVQVTHGLKSTLDEFDALPDDVRGALARDLGAFLDGLISHYVLDEGQLVVAHAGMLESMQGRASAQVRDFALYGETTGETDEFGLLVRNQWAAEYRGKARVVYGHVPVLQPEWLNNTIDVDTGCVYGGRLTALRYPELELVSVPARRVYRQPERPFLQPQAERLSAQQQQDELLDVQDVLGKHGVETALMGHVTIPEGNSAAALEVMSRFIVHPQWLIYLPPTMSPPEATQHPGYLEYPAEAFAYYRKNGVGQVVCEQKHMGSRLVAVVCRDAEVALRRFGLGDQGSGVLYTRTGRRFFADAGLETALLDQLRAGLEASGFWEAFHTGWVCLDCELMPW
ncbi:MAG: polynucleotide kinase-phosphatase, partial [Chloroflexi bacterium]|nr:polynucleotide kinase-phosphatase [Chloroflexota bacterium]